MATRIRLQRHGKKGKAFFHIVAADSRAKRDGKFIEKLGTYNPNTNPATIDINFERTLNWVQTGAEMSDTARAILSYKGILYKNHLLKGITKGALTAEQVETKFNAWLAEKDSKITGKKDSLTKKADHEKAARLKAETEANEAKAKEVEAKNTVVEEVEATPEVEIEATPEAEVEATPEAEVEATPEVEVEATPEVEIEATPEAEVEATPEVEIEVTPEVEGNSEVNTSEEASTEEASTEEPASEE